MADKQAEQEQVVRRGRARRAAAPAVRRNARESKGSKMSSRGLSSLMQATVISETHLRVPDSPSKETACGMERTSEASGKSGEFK